MRNLKSIFKAAVPLALEKALRYRLLNEPLEAESICLDILRVDPENQQALVTILLALTDLFDDDMAAVERAKSVLPRLTSEYDRAYYEGVIHERWAKTETAQHVPSHVVTGWYLLAMHCYERAEALAPPDNDDPRLRYNACVRKIRNVSHLEPRQPETRDPYIED